MMSCQCEEPVPRKAGVHPQTCNRCNEVIE